MDKLTQINALENGKGIQYLLDAANQILHNPIVVFDTDYALVAYTDSLPDDQLWEELITTGTFSMETQKFFAQECFTEEVANAAKLVMLKSNYLKYDRILANIENKENIKVANVLMCERSAFDADSMKAFEALAGKLSREIKNDEKYTAYGRAYHEDKLFKLLDGEINEPTIYTSHIQILYQGFDDYLYVAVVDTSQCNIGGDKNSYIKKMLQATYRSFKFTIFDDYIVMLISSKFPVFDVNLFFSMANNLFMQYNLHVGISKSFENLYELREYFDIAVASLKEGVGDNYGSEQRFFIDGKTVNTL